jgi:DNA-binding CsgD family transcriptional regulator
MFDADLLQAVVIRLGEAVIDPGIWTGLMEDICRALRTTGAALLQSDIRTADIPRTASVDELIGTYFKNNLHFSDIRASLSVPLLLSGQPVVIDQDIFASERDMPRDDMYDLIGHLGFRWYGAIGFRAGSALWGFSLQRTVSEGPFDPSIKKVLSSLSSRLTETATLSKAVGHLVLTGMTNALSLIGRPAIALDRSGRVVDVNNRAAALFCNDIRVVNRQLIVRDQYARSDLAKLAIRLRVTPDAAVFPMEPIVIHRERQHPIVITALPVDGAARGPFLGARVILVLNDLDAECPPSPASISQALGLTPSQARLAAAMATGRSLEEVAVELHISGETARNHLKAIFQRTGAHRQGELIALLARLP